jgi:SAM-dependent methyltransferase/uncharacterized protein YbaR (Trm112 family)
MRERLLDFLRCPLCHGPLALSAGRREGAHVMEGALACAACARSFPIIAGIPRLLPGPLPPAVAFTAQSFGQSWKIWKDIHDERYRWQFLRWLQPLQPEDFKDRVVLDGGCGKGRHLRVAAQFGARECIGVDLSEAVEVAFANTREFENVHVVQADLCQLPLAGGFDLAYSIGVLHHTPDPARSFAALAAQVRPGGTVACWVYGRENNGWIVCLVNPVRIGLTRYLPAFVVRGLAWVLASVLFAAIWLVYVPLAKLGLKPFYADYLMYLRDLGFAETRHIVYDHLIAPTAFYLRKAEVERWFDAAGLAPRTLSWVQKVSWAGVGKKP